MSFSIACISKCYDFLRPEAIAYGSGTSWPFEEVRKIFARLQKHPNDEMPKHEVIFSTG